MSIIKQMRSYEADVSIIEKASVWKSADWRMQVTLASRLADKLQERAESLRDVRLYFEYTDKHRLCVVDEQEFRSCLRRFGVVDQSPLPFGYDAIFGLREGRLIDYSQFLMLVQSIIQVESGRSHSAILQEADTFGGEMRTDAVAADARAKEEGLRRQSRERAVRKEEAAKHKMLQTIATKMYERRSGSLALTRAFACVDTDSSGTIDLSEFAVVMGMFGFEPRENEIKKLFAAFGSPNMQPIPYSRFVSSIESFRDLHPLSPDLVKPEPVVVHRCTACGKDFACRGRQGRVRMRCSICTTCTHRIARPYR